jgi:exosortase A-associated hydrolase 1
MNIEESIVRFRCGGDWLYGVLSPAAVPCTRGVLIVVGGPQYRVGSHRQFALLARMLAANGIAAMRFDYRGMGDSEGETRSFDAIQDDVRSAVDTFMDAVPGMREVVLWGLCDGASAITMYVGSDPRVSGIVLLNPWVRTTDGLARTTLRHYYGSRLRDRTFWYQLVRGRLNLGRSVGSMLSLVRAAYAPASEPVPDKPVSLPDLMYAGIRNFHGPVLVIIGGADLTGREFCDLADATSTWKRLMASSRVTRREIGKADHTFSRRVWRDQVADWTCDWLRSW